MLTAPQKAWVDALRSLKYPQSRSQLLCEFAGRDWQWSVMGVLCEVAFQHGVCNMEQRDEGLSSWIVYTHAGAVHSMTPPPAVLKWVGMRSGLFSLEFRGETRRFDLAACGMAGLRFSELARIIECEPAGLFPGSQGNTSGLYVLDERELERIWELKI